VSKALRIWTWIWMEMHVMPDMDGQHWYGEISDMS